MKNIIGLLLFMAITKQRSLFTEALFNHGPVQAAV
jgi:hypothetical protein